MVDSENRLVLGTAQLGLLYGVANKTGQPNQAMANEIVRQAWHSGIHEFDTAQGYGDSESVLGAALKEAGISNQATVISKFDPSLDLTSDKTISEALDRSLIQLGIDSLQGIMLHREELLSGWNSRLRNTLRMLMASGKVKSVGISVYTPEKAVQALGMPEFDFIQLPANILDRRFENTGIFEQARRSQKSIYIRSVFLQGLILMKVNDIPERLGYAKPTIELLDQLCDRYGLLRQEIALAYVKKAYPEAKVILGVEIPDQVLSNAASWGKRVPTDLCRDVKEVFRNVDISVLNPGLWPLD